MNNSCEVWVKSVVRDIVDSPANSLQDGSGERAWGEPLIGFANGADPLFQEYKTAVGDFHWTPLEIFHIAYPDERATADQLTVIVWILPQTKVTKRDNATQVKYPAERWARSRIFGEQFNHDLRSHVAATLTTHGYPSVAPMDWPAFKVHDSPKYVWASTWSERHAAHAAGLGTFGLCDGLITPVGKAVRIGSVVAKTDIKPTMRPYTHHQEYCLFYSHGTCGECMDRCPVGALSPAGHDKRICSAHLRETRKYVPEHYGFDGYGCGLCQVDVPCSDGIPDPNSY